jgi:transcriptional regulator with XRE-family HTH domain
MMTMSRITQSVEEPARPAPVDLGQLAAKNRSMADLPPDRLATLTQLVRDGRHQRNLNRRDFSRAVGISRTTLRAIEGGGPHQPTQDTLEKLARFLRFQVEHVTGHKAGAVDRTWVDLRPEDQQIGREFHHAATEVKVAIKRFFAAEITDDHRERLGRILHRLLAIRADDPLIASIEGLLAAHPADDPVVPQVESKRKKS